MPRHNYLSTGVNFKVTLSLYTSCLEIIQLADEVLGVKNYSCADKIEGVGVKDTRRYKVELIDLAVVYYSVTGVVSAL